MKAAKKIVLSFLMTLAIVAMAAGLRPVRAQAATKTIKNIDFSTELTRKIAKYATVVKRGTTTLKLKQYGNGYVRFKAPATKKYTFTFYGQTGPKSGHNNGYAYITTPVKSRLGDTDLQKLTFSTEGGKASTAWFHTKLYADTKKTTGAFLAKRNCKVKLKKGQTVYLSIHFADAGTVKLKIK